MGNRRLSACFAEEPARCLGRLARRQTEGTSAASQEMSDHAHEPEAETFDTAKLGSLPNNLLIAGVVGLALTALGAFVLNKDQFAYTYLFAFAFFFTVILGAAFWNCIHHATDSEWSVVIRRQIENVASLFP